MDVVGKVAEDIAAQLVEAQVAHHGVADADLAALQPLLLAAGSGGADQDDGDDQGQHDADRRGDDHAPYGDVEGGFGLGDPLFTLLDFDRLHGGDLRADLVHVGFAGIVPDDGQGGVEPLGAPGDDGRVQFGQLGGDEFAHP